MCKLLCLLIWGYVPKWKIIQENTLVHNLHGEEIARGTRYILQCEQTGKIRMKDCIG